MPAGLGDSAAFIYYFSLQQTFMWICYGFDLLTSSFLEMKVVLLAEDVAANIW